MKHVSVLLSNISVQLHGDPDELDVDPGTNWTISTKYVTRRPSNWNITVYFKYILFINKKNIYVSY